MAGRQRPIISAPSPRGIFDEAIDDAVRRGNGSHSTGDDQTAAAPAVVDEHDQADAEPEAAPAAPPARPRKTAAPARRLARRQQATPGVPEPPPGYIATRKPLQVYVDGGDHWSLKYGSMVLGTDMSSVVSALVGAFNADQQTWVALIRRAEEERVPLAELLAPYLERAAGE